MNDDPRPRKTIMALDPDAARLAIAEATEAAWKQRTLDDSAVRAFDDMVAQVALKAERGLLESLKALGASDDFAAAVKNYEHIELGGRWSPGAYSLGFVVQPQAMSGLPQRHALFVIVCFFQAETAAFGVQYVAPVVRDGPFLTDDAPPVVSEGISA